MNRCVSATVCAFVITGVLGCLFLWPDTSVTPPPADVQQNGNDGDQRITNSVDQEDTAIPPQRLGTGLHSERLEFASRSPHSSGAMFAQWNAEYHQRRSALRATTKRLPIHTFYTIDCSYHSLWQVLVLEDSWHRVKQGGFISRIVSGCEEPLPRAAGTTLDRRDGLARSILPPVIHNTLFGAFFAPTYSKLPSGEYYAPYNRPNAIWYWLNHSDVTESIFIALDPDMLYLRRLNVAPAWYKSAETVKSPVMTIKPGRLAAQGYGYMMNYRFERFRCDLCPNPKYYDDASHTKRHFAVGPPWIFTINDLLTIMPTWVALVPMLRLLDKSSWIIEMVAYSVACAYHNLPHDVIWNGMVDSHWQAGVWDEGEPTSRAIATQNKREKLNPWNNNDPVALLHYCMTYEVGETPPPDQAAAQRQHTRIVAKEKSQQAPVIDYYHFSKYRIPSDWPGGKGVGHRNILSCECPLIQEFHTVGALPRSSNEREIWLRNAFFLEALLPAVNGALRKWKIDVLNCTTPNFQQTLRTSHPAHWISRYDIIGVSKDRKHVEFREAAEGGL